MNGNHEENRYRGVSSIEADLAIKKGEGNRIGKDSESVLTIFLQNVFSYFNFIFAVLAGLLILTSSYKSLTFLPVIIANTCIGIVHRIRAKRLIDRLKVLNTDKAIVIRDGQRRQIDHELTVKGDLILLKSGEQIYADAVIEEGDLMVNESLVTGEADDIAKTAKDPLLSGSYISSGTCIARITGVGKDSYVNRLTGTAKRMKYKKSSEMLRDIDRIILITGVSIIPVGLLLFFQQYILKGSSLAASVVSMVAAVIGMIPEGLYLLAGISLAIGSAVLARKKILVQEMRALELLARADVICFDKTGTITDDTMMIEDLIVSKECSVNRMEEVLGCMSRVLPKENPTIKCIYEKYSSYDRKDIKVFGIRPFTSSVKYSRVETSQGDFKLGAPEILLKDRLNSYLDQANTYAKKGYRVLVLTRNDKEYIGLVLMRNNIRKSAKEILRFFTENHMEIKVISGDSPMTVSYIANRAGIENSDRYIDMSMFDKTEDIRGLADRYTVFGRTGPYQKKELILGLQKAGKTVAMVGDGVNDILALKTADCSFAMFNGARAACHASTMVLMDSDFSKMPEVIKEGRRVVNNMERSASLFLYKNIFSFLLALLSILAVSAYPLLPSQVAFVGAFTIGIPGFLLSREANYDIIKGSFMQNVLKKALVPALIAFISIGSLSLFDMFLKVTAKDLSVISALIYAFTGFYHLYRISRPLNRYRFLVLTSCIVLAVFFLFLFGKWFDIIWIPVRSVAITAVYFLIIPFFFAVFDFLIETLIGLKKKTKGGNLGE